MEQNDPLSINPEEDLIKKQQLLQREIIDKDLDKEKFMQLCLSKKKGGDDLNVWTYEELEQIVKEFSTMKVEAKKENLNIDDVNVESGGKMEKIEECNIFIDI